MIKEVKFTGPDATKSDIAAADGELSAVYGLIQAKDGSWAPLPGLRTLACLPRGFRAVAVHDMGYVRNLIVACRGVEGLDLHWCVAPSVHEGSMDVFDSDRLIRIGHVADIRCMSAIDNVLVIGTTEGIFMLCFDGEAYSLVPSTMPMPVLQFGLQLAGNLVTAERIVAPEGTVPSATPGYGDGSSNPHPLVSSESSGTINLSRTLIDSYKSALATQATGRGYISYPCMLRYALRMTGGEYLMVSPPVMLLPTVLPPRIGVSATEADGKSYISIDLGLNHYFQLRYRSLSAADQPWAGLISAIDVFVSRQVSTYDADALSHGYITDFSNVAAATGSSATLRGDQSRAGDGAAGIFDGHYSEGGDNYVDHYLPSLAQRAWYIAPNTALVDQLLNADGYFRVASLPYSTLAVMDSFAQLPLATVDLGALEHNQRLPEVAPAKTMVAVAMASCDRRLVVAVDSVSMPAPMALSAMAGFYGRAADGQELVEVTVFSRHSGRVHSVTTHGPGMAEPLSAHLPRYLWYPDPDAFLMVLRQGDACRVLPLSTDNLGSGAHWFRFGVNEGEVFDIPSSTAGSLVGQEGRIYTSALGNPWIFNTAPICLGSKVNALASAFRAPKSGQFGQYPMYALAHDGVFLLKYDDSLGRYVAARQVSADRCISPSAASDVDGRVFFAASGAIKMLEGSDCKSVSDALLAGQTDMSDLPCAADILTRYGIRQEPESLRKLLDGAILACDTDARMLVVGNPECDFSLLLNLDTGVWSTIDMTLTGTVYGARGWLAADHALVALAEAPQLTHAVMLTRPIKFDRPVSPQALSRVEVVGSLSPHGCCLLVYGSHDLRHWRLVASSKALVCDIYDSAPYRYWRILLISHLRPHDWIASLNMEQRHFLGQVSNS